MYTRRFGKSCQNARPRYSVAFVYANYNQNILHTNHNRNIHHISEHHSYNYNKHRLIISPLQTRSFCDSNKKESPKKAWQSARRVSRVEVDSTTDGQEMPSKSRLSNVASAFSKPFASLKSKVTRTKKAENKSEKSDKKVVSKLHRPDKRALPKPEEGIMSHIPSHKAQILHILQEECSIFPDEVFPLFPDHKTEETLSISQDWTGNDIKFVDSNDPKSIDSNGSDGDSDGDSDQIQDDDSVMISTEKEQLLLSNSEYGFDESDIDDIVFDSEYERNKSDERSVSNKSLVLMRKHSANGMNELSDSDLSDSKPKQLFGSKMRFERISGIESDLIDERGKYRDLDETNPFKYRDILSPKQIFDFSKLKHSHKTDSSNSDLYFDSKVSAAHPVWSQEPDNVYEIISFLREIGFASDQTSDVWPYSDLFDLNAPSSSVEGSDDLGSDLVAHSSSALNPLPDRFNDFYLLFSRFPEILTHELVDIRRKVHVLEQFQISDLRYLLLSDPRILRRPAHHIRMLLEVFDDYFIDDFTKMIELSPHFMAATSKKEMLARMQFLHSNVVRKLDDNCGYELSTKNLTDLSRNSEFVIKQGKAIEKTSEITNEMLNDRDKTLLADFVTKHPDLIGNCNLQRMNEMTAVLNKLGIKGKDASDLLFEYPQILTLSNHCLTEYINQIKMDGIRDYRTHFRNNVYDLLTLYSPIDTVQINAKNTN